MFGKHRNDQSVTRKGVSISAQQEITIVNELGLHARPAAEFARAARAFRSEIWLVKEQNRFSADSLIDVLTANLNRGETVTIEAKGPDAEEAVKRLVELIAEFGRREGKVTDSRRIEEDF
jgi:phosphocarrier protein